MRLYEHLELKILNEELKITNGQSLLTFIKKGMVGVSPKIFLGQIPDEASEKILDRFIDKVRSKNVGDFNSFIVFTIKKLGTLEVMQKEMNKLNEWFDSVLTYYLNKKKKESKTELKSKFDNFANSPYNFDDDKKFEQEINIFFSEKGKANIKDADKEIVTVYKSEGWEVYNPLTFAAAKKLACMNNRKATWCTAADPEHYKRYTANNSRLFIIKNESKDIMFQMDFDNKQPNFKNEKDVSATIDSFMEHNPPEALLKAIKNNKNLTLFDALEKFKEKQKETKEIIKPKTIPDKNIDGWSIIKLNQEETDNFKNLINVKSSNKKENGPKPITLEMMLKSIDSTKTTTVAKNTIAGGAGVFKVQKGDKIGFYTNTGNNINRKFFVKSGNNIIAKNIKDFIELSKEWGLPELITKEVFPSYEEPKKGDGVKFIGKFENNDWYYDLFRVNDMLELKDYFDNYRSSTSGDEALNFYKKNIATAKKIGDNIALAVTNELNPRGYGMNYKLVIEKNKKIFISGEYLNVKAREVSDGTKENNKQEKESFKNLLSLMKKK
jgi:hypothetical protein